MANVSSTRYRLGEDFYSFLVLPHIPRPSISDIPVCGRGRRPGMVDFHTNYCHIRVYPHTLLLDSDRNWTLHQNRDIFPRSSHTEYHHGFCALSSSSPDDLEPSTAVASEGGADSYFHVRWIVSISRLMEMIDMSCHLQ